MAIKNSNSKENESVLENGKKKTKEERPPTKIVVRRLPPTMTEEQFKMQVAPLPEIDYFYFVEADMSLTPNAFCRAYINFVYQADLFIFTQKFDGYVFLDSKGGEFPAVVEFAPFQRIPKNRPNRKKDPKCGTIEADPIFIAFKERLESELLESKTAANASKQHFFETSLLPEKKELNSTPLLDFIKNKRAERQRIRDEKREEKRKKDLERRRAKEDLRRTKKDDDISAVKNFNISPEIPKPAPLSHTSKSLALQSSQIHSNNNNTEKINVKDNAKLINDVPKKVCELVNCLNTINNKSDAVRNYGNLSCLQKCANHKDIEQDILNKTIKNSELNLKNKVNSCFSPKCSSAPSYKCNESNNLEISNNFHNLFKARDRVYVPQSTKVIASEHYTITNAKVSNSCKLSNESTSKKNDIKKDESCNAFSGHVFRKNLQLVVRDVLGDSNVRSSKGCTINKPKTFIKRVLTGSGEQCTRSGFNSPNFYLPPRSFGCGPSEVTGTRTGEMQSNYSRKSQSTEKEYVPYSGKPLQSHLPPFSKKYVSSSKSDGDIEQNEVSVKMVGSHESLQSRIEPQHVHRPHVTPRRFYISEKSCKVTFK